MKIKLSQLRRIIKEEVKKIADLDEMDTRWTVGSASEPTASNLKNLDDEEPKILKAKAEPKESGLQQALRGLRAARDAKEISQDVYEEIIASLKK